MRVNQKITVGSITINSVQNSSIVQIGSSGMIQSQSETYQSPTSNGNGTPAYGTTPKGVGPVATQAGPQAFGTPSTPAVPFAPPGATTETLHPDFNLPVFPGPLGPVGGIGIPRNDPVNSNVSQSRPDDDRDT